MNLVQPAMRRPLTIVVAVIAVALGSVLALRQMPRDIFPTLGIPTIYVAQPFGGMDPAQMEGYLTYYYEYHFLYITGIEHVESKNIQGAALLKLVFHPGTDMSQAMAQVVGYVNRARAFMPVGAVPPFIVRYDAGRDRRRVHEFMNAPVRTGAGPAVYLRDIGIVEVATDIISGYAQVNGRRTVYIPVTKRADASTLDVINGVRAAMPRMKAAAPEDVDIRLEFDQSKYVVNAIKGLMTEGLLGAVMTGLMVLMFLRDWRSSLIVITTIPFALLGAVIWLWAAGQTINIMTLGGLALAVGVLVDEATVEIENIHTHMAGGLSRARSVVDAARKTAIPRLLAMLCILSVFVPSFFMVGVGQQLFIPLSLAVGFAMVSSYILSSTLVPVLATWVMRQSHGEEEGRFRSAYASLLRVLLKLRWPVAGAYVVFAGLLLFFLFPKLRTELFPNVDAGQFQLRLRAPTGTRIERTELIELKALDIIKEEVGPENVEISTAFIGVQPAQYPVNTIYLFTSEPDEAVMLLALNSSVAVRGEDLKERLRARLSHELPDTTFSFEAGDIISQVMSFGSPTPIEVAVQGLNLAADR